MARLVLAMAIVLFLLYVALLPAPPLPHAVHHVLHLVVAGPHASRSSPAWIATVLRKLPEALLYGILALLLTDARRLRLPVFLSVSLYGLALELLRPLHAGRPFEPLDVVYEAVAALAGSYLGSLLRPGKTPTRDN